MLEQGEAGGAQDVFEARSPMSLEDAPKDANEMVDDEVLLDTLGNLQHVEPRQVARVDGVEEDHLALAARRRPEPSEDVGDEVALRVDDHRAAPGRDVAEDEVGEQRGLAAAGRTHDVEVVAGVFWAQDDGPS